MWEQLWYQVAGECQLDLEGIAFERLKDTKDTASTSWMAFEEAFSESLKKSKENKLNTDSQLSLAACSPLPSAGSNQEREEKPYRERKIEILIIEIKPSRF